MAAANLAGRLREPDKLEVIRQIGKGTFGTVLLARDPLDGEEYACKTEPLDATHPQLPLEWKVYRKLNGSPVIPQAYAMWVHEGKRWLATQVLGPSLEKCSRDVTQRDVMEWIAPQAIAALEELHRKHILHRDIKPENLLTGRGGLATRRLYLIDFGLCKRYKMTDEDHIPPREGKRLTGTVRYASVHTHLGEEQSRRDDLEALGYVLVWLLKGRLPWMGLGGADRHEQNRKVMQMKIDIKLDDLCEGLPPAFVHYFRHVRALRFEQSPDYALLKSYFKVIM